MRIDFKDTAAKTGNVTSQKAFTVEMNAMAFHTLIDGIYQDKFAAPIRELSTNAFDAHIAAGCRERPFVIRLPSYLDRTFSVRDYGVSLSHDEIMTTYTTMFASTKRDTNEQVGMIGLGSKSPFAYTSSFSVIAYLNGTRRTYSCYMDGGVPTIALMDTSPTNEENGLEVTFPVRSGDEVSFREAAKRVVFGFDVKPIVKNEGWKYEEPVPQYTGSNWRAYQRYDNKLGFQGLQVRQGTVVYPLDLSKVFGTGNQSQMQANSIVFDVPIGSVTVTTSREELGYDDRTKEFLKKLITKFIEELKTKLTDEIAKQPTYLDACRTGWKMLTENPYNYLGNRISVSSLTWNGKALRDTWEIKPVDKTQFCVQHPGRSSVVFRPNDYGYRLNVSHLAAVAFYWQQPGLFRCNERMRMALASHKGSGVGDIIWFRCEDPKEFMKQLPEGITYTDLSTVDYAKTPKLSKKNLIRARRVNAYNEIAAQWFEPSDVTYYCLTRNRNVVFGTDDHHEANFQSILRMLEKAGLYDNKFIAVTAAPHPTWKCFFTHMKETFDKKFKPADHINEQAFANATGRVSRYFEHVRNGPDDLMQLLAEYRRLKAKYENTQDTAKIALNQVAQYFLPDNYTWPKATDEVQKFADNYQKMTSEKYKLLDLIFSYGDRMYNGSSRYTYLNHYMDLLK